MRICKTNFEATIHWLPDAKYTLKTVLICVLRASGSESETFIVPQPTDPDPAGFPYIVLYVSRQSRQGKPFFFISARVLPFYQCLFPFSFFFASPKSPIHSRVVNRTLWIVKARLLCHAHLNYAFWSNCRLLEDINSVFCPCHQRTITAFPH